MHPKLKPSNLWPALTLLLLAPLCGEMLSTSSPPAEFFQPITLISLVMLYGCGALLIRELARRWKQGWISIFLLGLAYGIYEEGIVVRSFFDPSWPDLGILNVYGRWLGVNWVWALALSLFHVSVSTTLPILLTELLFPAAAERPWLGRGSLAADWVAFLLMIPIGPLFGMHASLWMLGGCGVVMLFLGVAAYAWPKPGGGHVPVPAPGWFVFLAGLGSTLGLIVVMWILPGANAPVWLTMAAGLALPGVAWLLITLSGGSGWGARQKWAFASGMLLLWALMAIFVESDPKRVDNVAGSAMAGWAFLLLLAGLGTWVYLRTRQKSLESI